LNTPELRFARLERLLLFLLGVFICAPLGVAEQAARLPRIGVLWPSAVDRWIKAFQDGLRENGYIDGATATIDVRSTGGNVGSGQKLAEELIQLDPDVIYAVPGMLAKDLADARKRASKQIPIVFVTWDPVAERLVDSVAHPGGNMTGIGGVAAPGELLTKHLQLLKETLPRLKRIACLIDMSWKDISLQTKTALEKSGPGIGVQVSSIELQGPDDVERALSEVARRRADAMIVPLTPTLLAARSHIIAFASKHRLPTAYTEEVFTYDGGVMSYGYSVSDKYHDAATIIAKILHGAKPGDIPVDYSMRFKLVINLKTAKALGLRIPQSLLIQADEVIR
jgi:putative ABC transport system substrate-binding protein